MGHVDILVNNAGITRDALALRLRDEDWQAVIEVNLTAAFRLARAALRGMVRRRHGRVIAIAPVLITTAMTDKLTDEQRARIAATIPMGRFGTAEDVAAAAVYLASAEASYITGQTLHVNGGMAML